MDELEVLLADIGETTTRKLAEKHKPIGLEENRIIAKVWNYCKQYKKRYRIKTRRKHS